MGYAVFYFLPPSWNEFLPLKTTLPLPTFDYFKILQNIYNPTLVTRVTVQPIVGVLPWPTLTSSWCRSKCANRPRPGPSTITRPAPPTTTSESTPVAPRYTGPWHLSGSERAGPCSRQPSSVWWSSCPPSWLRSSASWTWSRATSSGRAPWPAVSDCSGSISCSRWWFWPRAIAAWMGWLWLVRSSCSIWVSLWTIP